MTQKMTLHRVLSELKTLDKRINNGVAKLDVIGIKKGDKFLKPVSEDEFTSNAKADVESLEALIQRRYDLKRALILANATHTVIVNGMAMTIAEAIDYKAVISYKELEYKRLNRLYQEYLAKFENESRTNEEKLNNLILSATGKDSSKADASTVVALTKSYNETNAIKAVDPINLKQKLETLRNEIDGFMTEVDAVLSEANATVTVEV